MDFDASLEGLDELYKVLGFFKGLEYLRPPMQKTVYLLQERIAHYPPQKPTSNRDGTLGRTWTTEVNLTASDLEGKVGNKTEYGPWVQSKRFQAWMHRGWWQTDEDVMRDSTSDIEFLFVSHMDAMTSKFSS